MKYKRFIVGILLISMLLLIAGCSVRKNVKIKEVKEFTESILESNEKIKELDFYFIKPDLYADLVYDGDLDEKEIQSLIEEFKTLIDIEFMDKIGEKYWKGLRPNGFGLYIYLDNIKDNNYDYLLESSYRKDLKLNDSPDNIDGYQTYTIFDPNISPKLK